MRICGNCNVRKEKEINNGEQYITLDIYLQLDCLENLEVTSSISSYYVGKSGKGLTTYLTLTTIMSSNKKQEARTDNTDVVNQYLIKLLEDFKYSPYTRYRKRKVKNEPTGADLFLGKQISQLLKKKKHIILCSKIIKHGAVNKKHFNKTIRYGITSMNERNLELTKEMRTRDSETNKEEKNLSMYENEDDKK